MSDSSAVCVVGCGLSGILAVKYCLEYGLSVHCYELRPCLGGIWTGSDPSVPQSDSLGRALTSVHDFLTLNTSQFVTTFSDFPLPEDLLQPCHYLDARSFLLYLNRYAAHFGVERHVTFSTRVLRVARAVEGSRRWAVTVRREEEGSEEFTTFHDHVIVASGLYGTPFTPETFPRTFKVPGLRDTPVRCLHSAHVRNLKEKLEGERVLIVGGSISAADIAEGAVKAGAQKVTWALTRDPTARSVFLFPRHPFGQSFAWDEWLSFFMLSCLPAALRFRLLRRSLTVLHEAAPGAPINVLRDRIVLQNAEVVHSAVAAGRLEVRSTSLAAFEGRTALLRDGSRLEADVCVFATGFVPLCPFLGSDVLGEGGLGGLTLHRFLLALDAPAWGLVFAYTTTVTGSGVVATEMEMRWVAHQLANGQLASEADRQQLLGRPGLNAQPFQCPLRRDVFDVVDNLAQDLGCQPQPFLTLLLSPSLRQRRLAAAVAFGAWLPQHYRLRGPHAGPEAAEAAVLRAARSTTTWRFQALALATNLLYLCGSCSFAALLAFTGYCRLLDCSAALFS